MDTGTGDLGKCRDSHPLGAVTRHRVLVSGSYYRVPPKESDLWEWWQEAVSHWVCGHVAPGM